MCWFPNVNPVSFLRVRASVTASLLSCLSARLVVGWSQGLCARFRGGWACEEVPAAYPRNSAHDSASGHIQNLQRTQLHVYTGVRLR